MPEADNRDIPSGARSLQLITKAATDLPGGVCAAILCGTAGTMNGITAAGETVSNVPVQAGYNPIEFQRVTTGGTADDLWALYK